MERKNVVLELSFDFALQVIEFSELLEEIRKYVIARQLLKSGTNIGANIREAQSCESKADFIHILRFLKKRLEKLNIGCFYAPKQRPIRILLKL